MKTQAALLSALLLVSGQPVLADPPLVIKPTGTMRIQLAVPTDTDVDQVTPISGGYVEILPVPALFFNGLAGRFWLNQLSLEFVDVSVSRRPFGDHTFRSIGVHLKGVVPIWAAEGQPNVYTFSIPPNEILFHVGTLDNGELNSGDKRPQQDVTGTIDLAMSKFQATAVISVEDEILGVDVGGPLTITLGGTIGPDTDMDGVPDDKDNCVLVPNAMARVGLGQLVQPPVVSPLVTPPPAIHSQTCNVTSLGIPTGVDVCHGTWVDFTNDAPRGFGIGATTVTWTGQAASGRSGSASQSVVVTDRTAPVFLSVPPAITFSQCHPASIGVATANDDCGGRDVLIANNAPTRFPVGRTTVVWTATDRYGNRATASQSVAVTSCGGL